MKHIPSIIVLCFLLLSCKDNAAAPTESGQFVTRASISSVFTAAKEYPAVLFIAREHAKGAVLKSVTAVNVDLDGGAVQWKYEYRLPAVPDIPMSCAWFHANLDGAAFDSTTMMNVGCGVLRKECLDSDYAMEIAENGGGRQFRFHNPDAVISAGLYECGGMTTTAFWSIYYRSASDPSKILLIRLNAVSGAIIETLGGD